jgi:hypothetical protein
VRRVLGLYLGSHRGRNDFEGTSTERVYTLVARARVFWRIVLDARVMALCERFLQPGFLLTASQAIQIHPARTPQPFHSDDSFYTIPRPRPMVSLSTIVAVDAFTARERRKPRWCPAAIDGTTGGSRARTTRAGQPTAAEVEAAIAGEARAVEMPAGGCVVFAGTLVHRGGANRSDAVRCDVLEPVL